jgi:galactokinase
MDARAVAARLQSAGLSPTEEPRIVRLFASVLDTCARAGAAAPQAAWWIPGRLEVFGTHTDYAGGRTLVAALPRGFAFVMAPREDRQVRIADAATGGRVTIDPDRLAADSAQGWRHYTEVAVARLARNFTGATFGADVVVASNLPRAAGMSSSSALVVGIATALVQAAGIRQRPEWQENIGGALEEAGYFACIENGRTFGSLEGDAGVGTHGGSEDHAAMVAGTAGACTSFAVVPMRRLNVVPVPASWVFVVASSGVGAHKTGSERAAYNRLSEGARVLLDLWNASGPTASSLAAAISSSPSSLSRLEELADRSTLPDWPSTALRARLTHFVREDQRVDDAAQAIAAADEEALGRLARESQRDGEELLRNQVEETSALVSGAMAAGAFAARSFGAGFGGSVWALVRRDDAGAFAARWVEAYRQKYAAGRQSVAFVSEPGPPVTRVS